MKPAIVCVDDDAMVLASLGEQLSRGLGEHYDIELVTNAAETLELLQELQAEGVDIPVIISDQRMPGISGTELLAQVHQLCPKILSILLTGESSIEDVAKAVNTAHLYRYIPKPWDQTDLMLTVKEALRSYFQEKEIQAQRQALSDANHQLEKSLSLLEATLESTADGILVVDNEGYITHFNRKLINIWGIDEELILNYQKNFQHDNCFLDIVLNQIENPESFLSKVEQLSAQATPESYDILTLNNGKTIECFSQLQRLNGQNTGRVWSFQDITERRAAETVIHYQANYDYLTGLCNRMQLNHQLEQLIDRAQTRQERLAVLFIDLDHFKEINDTLGHVFGDCLLQLVVNRLQRCCRQQDLIARWGGDEFTMVLPRVESREDIVTVAQRLLASLQPSFEIEGQSIRITCSIGIALYPEDGQDTVTLLKNADTALYQAKTKGRNDYQCYALGSNPHTREQLALEHNLYQALEQQEFCLYYQPQVDIATGTITHMEALLRWQHPQLGFVAPSRFIPLAEQKGLILPIGQWVLQTACEQAIEWQAMGLLTTIAVNLSPRQLWDRQLLNKVEQTLAHSGLDPRFLELEITETAAMRDVDLARTILLSLEKMGINIALDDFGTGYSSLSNLKQLPFQTLKIDQSFVRDLLSNPQDAAIVESLLTLGRRLNIRVVAEGVETLELQNLLQTLQCQHIQGYWFSRPLPVQEATQMLQKHNTQVSLDNFGGYINAFA
jgi:diguanylate cyclase (GGDEF)-like protein/PAS domain S-box-containing protein